VSLPFHPPLDSWERFFPRQSSCLSTHIALLELSRADNHNDSNLGRGGIIHLFFQWTLFEISVRAQSTFSQRSQYLDRLVSHAFACHCDIDLWVLFQIWEESILFKGDHEPLEAPCDAGCGHVSFSVYSTELVEAATAKYSTDILASLIVRFEDCSVVVAYPSHNS